MVILDIPDSGAYYVYDGDIIDNEMIRAFIGPSPCPCPRVPCSPRGLCCCPCTVLVVTLRDVLHLPSIVSA